MSGRFEIVGYGEPLRWTSATVPDPAPHEVVVRNHAIGLNPSDWKMVDGWFASNVAVEFPFVPGSASAGVVEKVGTDVSRFAVGDRVVVHGFGGAFQEHRIVNESQVAPLPRAIDATTAAAIPAATTTGWALVDQLDIDRGDTLLVHGAAGGVGSAAVQVARARGARVLGTASPRNFDYLRAIGAEPVEYGPGLVGRLPADAGVTAVADAAGGEANVEATLSLRSDASRTITAVSDSHSNAGGIPAVVRRAEALGIAVELVASRVIEIRLGAVLPLAEAEPALADLRAGRATGRLILLA